MEADAHIGEAAELYAVGALTDEERGVMMNGAGRHVIYESGNTYRSHANKDNDFLIDRGAQFSGRSYSGIAGFAMQDSAVQELMGPIVDRSQENLVGTDRGIVMARRRLVHAAQALAVNGAPPPGIDPAHQRLRAAAIVLPPDKFFAEAASEALKVRPGQPHASV